jgi:hypothetical protein
MMAEETTRRALIVASAALPAVVASPVSAEETLSSWETRRIRRRDFINYISGLHPSGRYVATKAMAMDLAPEDYIQVGLSGRGASKSDYPQLYFQKVGSPNITIVGPHAEWLTGPVL